MQEISKYLQVNLRNNLISATDANVDKVNGLIHTFMFLHMLYQQAKSDSASNAQYYRICAIKVASNKIMNTPMLKVNQLNIFLQKM